MRLMTSLIAAVTLMSGSLFAQCGTTDYGTSCGPVASGSVRPQGGTHRVSLSISGAAPTSQVIMVIGLQEIAVPMPGFENCLLHTDWVFWQTHRTDTNGEYTYSRAVPASSMPEFNGQYIEVTFDGGGALNLRSTNGVRFGCM